MGLRSIFKIKKLNILLALTALVVAAILPTILTSRYAINLLIQIIIFALFAMSLDLLVGYLGHISFGHAAFYGMASFTFAILTVRYQWNWLPAGVGAVLAAGLLAALFGLVLSHLTGIQYGMVTFALGMVVWGLAMRWNSMTGGVNGISGAPRPVIWGLKFSGVSEYYYFVFGVFVVCAFTLYILVRSPFGLSMKGIKQTQSRMRVLGFNVWLHKYITYIVAGFFAGIAGVLMSSFNSFVSAEDTWLLVSAKGLLMVLAGGPGTLWGSLLGGGALVLLEDTISSYLERWNIVMGFLYIAVVVFLPGGLMQLLHSAYERIHRPTSVQPSPVVE